MTDRHTAEQRHKNMAAVKNKNTGPEIALRKFLFKSGLRYRINFKSLPGRPDIAITKNKCAIFVHGCFWHGHKCNKGKLPTTNLEFWNNKITNNKKRDLKNSKELKKMGWKVISIWECEIKKQNFNKLRSLLNF